MGSILNHSSLNKSQCVVQLTKNVPQTHDGTFRKLLLQLPENRLQELAEQNTNIVVFGKENVPDFYKKDVEKDRDTILDSILIQIFKDNPKGGIASVISKDQQSRINFVKNHIEEQKKTGKPLPAIKIGSSKITIENINDLNILSNTGAYYDCYNKNLYVPKWNKTEDTFAHEIGHALDDAAIPDIMHVALFSQDNYHKAKELRELYFTYLHRTNAFETIPQTVVGPEMWSTYAASFAREVLAGRSTMDRGIREYFADGIKTYLINPTKLQSADPEMYDFVHKFLTQ